MRMTTGTMESDNLQILNVGHASLDRNWNWSDVGSPFTRIYCVTAGRAWILINNRREELLPGYLYIIPAFTRHSYECHGPFAHYYLHIYESERTGTGVLERYELPVRIPSEASDEALFESICRLYPDGVLRAYNPDEYDNKSGVVAATRRFAALGDAGKMYIRGAILMLLSRFIAHSRGTRRAIDRRLERVLAFIEDHLADAVDLDMLAREACMSKAYLIRIFRRTFDTTPLAYVNRRRMEKAQLQLLATDMSVKEIAYSLGFADSSYFSRLFRKHTGCTPAAYRPMGW